MGSRILGPKRSGLIPHICRGLAALALVVCVVALVFALVGFLDLYRFEFRPLAQLLGLAGLLVVAASLVGGVLLGIRLTSIVRKSAAPKSRFVTILLAMWLVMLLYVLQWLLLEVPLTNRLTSHGSQGLTVRGAGEQHGDFADFSLTSRVANPADRSRLFIAYERIRINCPAVYAKHPIGVTIDRAAAKYGVDPEVLFLFAYINSFWGEATSGPMPFTGMMTPETLRDLVQMHLPGWFIENPYRRRLIESDALERWFGEGIGFKLRYAIHKATLDVSAQPYDINLISDLLPAIQQYPQEFPEITGSGPGLRDPVVAAMRESYMIIGHSALKPPYEKLHSGPDLDEEYYRNNRAHLKKFARAAYYRIALDFEFATRVMALVLRYQGDHYAEVLGAELWNTVPSWQRAGMLAMTRDLFVPNVGHLGPNVYSLCEINCTPVSFVAEQAAKDFRSSDSYLGELWRPAEYTALWAGAGTKLRIFNELHGIIRGSPIPSNPGLAPGDTVAEALRILTAE